MQKWGFYNGFYILLLEQYIKRKKWFDKIAKLNTNNGSKKYNIEVIWDNVDYKK